MSNREQALRELVADLHESELHTIAARLEAALALPADAAEPRAYRECALESCDKQAERGTVYCRWHMLAGVAASPSAVLTEEQVREAYEFGDAGGEEGIHFDKVAWKLNQLPPIPPASFTTPLVGFSSPLTEEQMRGFVGHVVAFVDELPDGEYKGLGRLRAMLRECEALLSAPAQPKEDEK